ncbi:hypothetical protein DFJ58DRAFT_781878 [Suillus subalutaceus]|uniref:uncharacterized protein n=1 Tax=Suillus subalutaceus TaxID=48586 RepID=UPI001B862E9A|nr:uncharacterized protein DFJ58DRAFT_781878 [Suillus subalutaceus]KAG1858368.1 hypothetical protein DFJ58DRAFT_781878 [Suillus subalutaceus]
MKCSPDTSTHVVLSVRLEQGFMQGAQIGVFYDPMIVRLVVCGHSAKPLFDAIQCQRE